MPTGDALSPNRMARGSLSRHEFRRWLSEDLLEPGNPNSMKKFSFPHLVQHIIQADEILRGVWVFLCDSDLPSKLLMERVRAAFDTSPLRTDQIARLPELVEDASTPPLFGTPSPVLFQLPPKLTRKQWKQIETELSRLPSEQSAHPPFWLLGPSSLRTTLTSSPDKAEKPSASQSATKQKAQIVLSYLPGDREALQVIESLLTRYPVLSSKPEREKQELALQCRQVYEQDLSSIDDHLERMNTSRMGFADVFTDTPKLGVFQVIDALATGKLSDTLLRLQQCRANGEDLTKILASIHHFARQLLRFRAARMQGFPEREAFQKIGIPFPAQAKFSSAFKNLKTPGLLEFLRACPDIERNLRQSPKNEAFLSVELSRLLQ